MADPTIAVPAILLAAAPLGAVVEAVLGHFSTTERTSSAMDALSVDFSPVTELMAAATCAIDDDDETVAA